MKYADQTLAVAILVLASTAVVAETSTSSYEIPSGYVRVWEDDRLNPRRAQGTASGEAQMRAIWSDTVPRKRIVAAPVSQVQQGAVTASPRVYQELDGVFVQVGSFSDQGAAAQAAASLETAGVDARRGVLKQGSKATPIVLAGPYSSVSAANTDLARIQGLGFRSAFVRN